MRKVIRFVLPVLITAIPIACSTSSGTSQLSYDDAIQQVRQSEIDFAKAFADRSVDRFAAFVDEKAVFLAPRRTLKGKAEVMSVWAGMIREAEAPFSWHPERVIVNGDATLGLSTGPIHDREGKVIGQYSSIWQRQRDGSWKVIFDGPGCFPSPGGQP